MKWNAETLNRDINPQTFYRTLGVFFVLLLAAAASWGVVQGTSIDTRVRADSVQYIRYAWNLKHEGVYSRDTAAIVGEGQPEPDAFRSPGYPLALVPLINRAPNEAFYMRGRYLNFALFVATIGLAFFLFRSFMGYGFALAAAALTAISPHLVNAGAYLLTETLFAFMVAASLVALVWTVRRPGAWVALLAGSLVGYGSLVRPSLEFFPLLVLPFLWFQVSRDSRARVAAAFIVGFLVVMCSWGIRNWNATGQWSDSRLAVESLQHGSYPWLMYENDPDTYGVPYREDPNYESATQDLGSAVGEIFRKTSEQPARYLSWYALGKPVMLWQWHLLSETGDIFIYPVDQSPYYRLAPFQVTHWLMKHLHWPAVVLAALASFLVFVVPTGGWLGPERVKSARLVALLLIYMTALHMVAAPYPRYSIPIRPELYGMAVFGLFTTFQYLYEKWRRGAGPDPQPGGISSN